jgi:DNA polymerase III gamma/tau subunit
MDKELTPVVDNLVDIMSNTYFERFLEFVEAEDVETSKALMDEWIVDGVDPEDGEVEFIWLENKG